MSNKESVLRNELVSEVKGIILSRKPMRYEVSIFSAL
jgi:hypothetical protein